MKQLFLACLAVAAGPVAAGPAYPLKLAEGKHHVVDQNNKPFFIQGDSPWFLIQAMNGADVDYYLSNRWVQGFNSIILGLTLGKDDGALSYDGDVYGQLPFTNTLDGKFTNLLSWNERYFTNVDAVIRRAADYGLCVFAYPLYDGFNGRTGYRQMTGNSTMSLYAFGQFIGNRYKDFTNLVWVGAGDFSEPNPPDYLWNWVAAGIRSEDTNHLFTAQAARPMSAASYYSNFVTLNSTYGSYFHYIESLDAYQRTPILACFAREPYYEHRDLNGAMITALDCRRFAWWAILSGDAGHFFGNERQWPFSKGWQQEMWSPGTVSITNVIRLINTRPWYDCVPDADHSVVISGYGKWGSDNYVTVTHEPTGKTVLAYVPGYSMSPTVDMARVSGDSANAWWYNPRTGAASFIGNYLTEGTRTFTPIDGNDWVLVLDDASLKWTAPGVPLPQVYLQAPPQSAHSISTDGFQLTVFAEAAPAILNLEYTTDFAAWEPVGTVTNATGAVTTVDFGASNSPARFYRVVIP